MMYKAHASDQWRRSLAAALLAVCGRRRLTFLAVAAGCRKLMKAFCAKASLDIDAVKFLYDGHILTGNESPQDWQMQDCDQIQVAVAQASPPLAPPSPSFRGKSVSVCATGS